MALFGLSYPICIFLVMGLFIYVKILTNNAIKENFTHAHTYQEHLVPNYTLSEKNSDKIYTPSRCANLNFNNCIQTSQCGWLLNGSDYSRCLPGTPVGPLNPKLQPDAENNTTGNIQNNSWIYSHRNPFIFC